MDDGAERVFILVCHAPGSEMAGTTGGIVGLWQSNNHAYKVSGLSSAAGHTRLLGISHDSGLPQLYGKTQLGQ